MSWFASFALRRRCLLPALLATLAPMPAHADLTATYQRPGARAAITIEVASNGDMRVSGEDDGYKLWAGGEGYEVMAGPGGPLVMRVAEIAATRAGVRSSSVMLKPWVPVGEATVAGRAGTKYMISGAENNPDASALVISRDPALTALRDAFIRYEAMGAATFPGDDGPERKSLRAALSTGAPIDYAGLQLIALSTAPIPPERFRLPASPVSTAEVQAYWAPPPQDAPPTPEELKRQRDASIRRAIFAGGKLWLLTDSGALSSLAPGSRARHDERVPGRVADICASAGAPLILAIGPHGLALWRNAGAGWQPLATVKTGEQEFIEALSCSPKHILVLTNARVIILESGHQRAVPLSAKITGPSVMTTPLDTGPALYVGLDQGEWGGGLVRIDLASGAMTKPSRVDGGLCAGPLNPGCDPVNGVAREPGKPGCLVVAIGLVHFYAHGRLTELCGNRIRRLYYKPYTVETSWPPDPPTEPDSTVPFYGLAEAGGTLWAVGSDGLYAISSDGRLSFRKTPVFDDADGVAVSFAVPGLVLVRTSINGRVALSGAVPILVPR